jgi:hypothetical protein
MTRSATTVTRAHSAPPKRRAAPAEGRPNVEVYRGTKSDKVKVEG